MKRVLFITIIIGIIIGYLLSAYLDRSAGAESQPTATTTFDHSQCQYPNRATNPPDGCDNSDPARPECMKGGTEDCSLPNPVQPIAPISTPPQPSSGEVPAPHPICQ